METLRRWEFLADKCVQTVKIRLHADDVHVAHTARAASSWSVGVVIGSPFFCFGHCLWEKTGPRHNH